MKSLLSPLRLTALVERLRTSLWLLPSVSCAVAIIAGVLLPRLEVHNAQFGFAGSPDGARAVLSAVAGSMITVTGLTFSLTVVALQMAASQFTPRFMRAFLADRGNQAVLSVFLGTFAYTVTVLRSVRNALGDAPAFVPDIAVGVGLLLTGLSVAMLVYFIHHLTQQLRIETVLAQVQRDTIALARADLDARGGGGDGDGDGAGTDGEGASGESVEAPSVPYDATRVPVRKSGYLQAVDGDGLRDLAVERGLTVRLRAQVGEHVVAGTTLAWAWPTAGASSASSSDEDGADRGDSAGGGDDGGDDGADLEDLARALHDGIQIGDERSLQQDLGFGIRQLVDIAVRALSPGINDPATAVAAIDATGNVMAVLCGHVLEPVLRRHDGRMRVYAPRPDFTALLALACDQPRRYGAGEPDVLRALLEMLSDLAELASTDEHRTAILSQVEGVQDTLPTGDLLPTEQEAIRERATAVRDIVAGVRP